MTATVPNSGQFSIAYFLDQSTPCVMHHGACTTATTMGAAGDAQWAQQVITNGDAQPCACLVGPLVVPSSGPALPDGWPHAVTDNGVVIVPGLRVRDYNWRETTVSATLPHESHGVFWFDTENGGMFDGSRLFAL